MPPAKRGALPVDKANVKFGCFDVNVRGFHANVGGFDATVRGFGVMVGGSHVKLGGFGVTVGGSDVKLGGFDVMVCRLNVKCGGAPRTFSTMSKAVLKENGRTSGASLRRREDAVTVGRNDGGGERENGGVPWEAVKSVRADGRVFIAFMAKIRDDTTALPSDLPADREDVKDDSDEGRVFMVYIPTIRDDTTALPSDLPANREDVRAPRAFM